MAAVTTKEIDEMTKFKVTLKALRAAGACISGYNKLVCALTEKEFDEERETYIRYQYDEPISIEYILDSNGLDDALWALRAVPKADRDCRHYAVWCARQAQHLMTDSRSIAALDVSERHADGLATDDELAAARAAAWTARASAVDAARAAQDVAQASAVEAAWAAQDVAQASAVEAALAAARDAARAARDAAQAAARDAARDAAQAAAWDAAWAAAWDAAWASANSAARAAAQDTQADMLRLMCRGKAPWQQ